MSEALLLHLAPVGWQHINLTGDYLWDADAGLPRMGSVHCAAVPTRSPKWREVLDLSRLG